MSTKSTLQNIVKDYYSRSSEASDEDFAKGYLSLFYKFSSAWNYGDKPDLYNPIGDIVNEELKPSGENIVALSTDDVSLASLTKRVALISEKTILSHANGESLLHKREHTGPMDWEAVSIYATCPNLHNLGVWLRSCKELVSNGLVFYLPSNIRCVENYHDATAGDIGTTEASYSYMPDLVVKERLVSEILNESIPVSTYIKPIITLDLPYIENANLETFSKIITDESLSVAMLREFLKEQFLSMAGEEGSESYFTQVEKLKIEMRKGVHTISRDIKMLNKKNSFLASGAIIASAAATLIAISSEAIGQWQNIIGTSGGLFLFHKLLENSAIERQKIKHGPFYYLWVMHEKSG